MRFTIEEKDWAHLIELSVSAQRAPVMALSIADGLAGRDFASLARQLVFDYWNELGDKYGFDGTTVRPIDERNRIIEAHPKQTEAPNGKS